MSTMSGLSKSGKQSRRRYSGEFKRDAVGLVTAQGYSLAEAARSLGVHVSLIRNWKEKFVGNKHVTNALSNGSHRRTMGYHQAFHD